MTVVVVTLDTPGRSTRGRAVENAAVRWSRVAVSVVPAWRMGKAINTTMADGEGDKFYCPPMLPEFRDEVDVLVGLGFEFVFTS